MLQLLHSLLQLLARFFDGTNLLVLPRLGFLAILRLLVGIVGYRLWIVEGAGELLASLEEFVCRIDLSCVQFVGVWVLLI